MALLKPQDILVLLKLVAAGDPEISFGRLAAELGMSPSEVHQAVKRAERGGLLRTKPARDGGQRKEVNRSALREFLVHGLRYVFPAVRGGESRGIPTGADAPVMKGLNPTSSLPAVWPHPEGSVRGLEFEPIYSSAAGAAQRDDKLYDLLALVDAIRGGRARERGIAIRELERRLSEDNDAAS